jgi:ATP-binding cassette subfamily B protein
MEEKNRKKQAAPEIPEGHFFKTLSAIAPLIFTRENVGRLTGSVLTTFWSTAINIGTPFILTQAIKLTGSESTYDILHDKFELRINGSEMVIIFSALWTLGRVLPSLRKLLLSKVISTASTNAYHKSVNHIISDLSYRYNLETPFGLRNELALKSYLKTNEYATQLLMQLLPSSIETITSGTVLSILYGWPMGVAIGAMLVGSGIFNLATSRFIALAQGEDLKTQMKIGTKGAIIIRNYETIHFFNNAPHELTELKRNLNKLIKTSTKSTNTPDMISAAQTLLISIVFGGINFWIANNISNKKYSLDDFIVISYFLMQFITPLINFGEGMNKIKAAVSELSKVIEFWNFTPEIQDDHTKKLDATNAEISFEHVSFGYDKDNPVLKDISFKIPAGKKVGIVGMSGAGKSTITKLLYRFYDISEGSIKINGEDIRNVSLASLRSAISIIPQKPTLFNKSIQYNLQYGALSLPPKLQRDQEFFDFLLDALQLRKFITDQKDGLKTKVGEDGQALSGGQAQRVAGARALLKRPDILILDEATSALDVETEALVQHSFDSIAAGTTTLVITHHLPTVRNADYIIVLDQGNIAETGTHQELLDKQGLYFNMWTEQSEKYKGINFLEPEAKNDLSLRNRFKSKSSNSEQPILTDPTNSGLFAPPKRKKQRKSNQLNEFHGAINEDEEVDLNVREKDTLLDDDNEVPASSRKCRCSCNVM